MGDDHELDAAAEAFEGVRGELALMRRAVERLAAERAEVPEFPDYSETLGKMAKALNATMQNVGVLAKAAEDNVAPRYVADRIVAAGAHARDEDRRLIATAGEKMDKATTALQASPQALYAEQRFSGHNVNIGVRQRREGTGRGFRG